ncbi:MAG: hypothetical protein K9M45_03690 [Kiritimatiellales bacterium]|nr:hypothetical protein [Kiritimatiellales bacterium]
MEKNRKPSRFPIIMSAVLPGSGQFVQGRWVPAIIFSSGFLTLFGWFVWAALQIIVAFYKLGLEFETAEDVEVHAASFLLPLVFALAVWFASLIDAVAAYQRARTAQARRKLPDLSSDTAR